MGDVADLDDVIIVCIGPKAGEVAAKWAREVGIATDHTLEGMLARLEGHFRFYEWLTSGFTKGYNKIH